MKVMILGGTGIISSGITSACLGMGYEVIHFIRGNTTKNVTRIQGNRNSFDDLVRAAKMLPDVVIDMLCFDVNQAEKVIKAFGGRTRHMILCSTACVYDLRRKRGLLNEDIHPDSTWNYGRSKAECERCFLTAHDQDHFQVTVFRPGHVYGNTSVAHQLGADNLVLSRIHKGLPALLLDGGDIKWQACHSIDAGVAFATACYNPRCYNKTYNLAYPEVITWREYYMAMGRALSMEIDLRSIDSDILEKGKNPERYAFALNVGRYDFALDVKRLQADIPEFCKTLTIEDGMRQVWLKISASKPNAEYDDYLNFLLKNRSLAV